MKFDVHSATIQRTGGLWILQLPNDRWEVMCDAMREWEAFSLGSGRPVPEPDGSWDFHTGKVLAVWAIKLVDKGEIFVKLELSQLTHEQAMWVQDNWEQYSDRHSRIKGDGEAFSVYIALPEAEKLSLCVADY